MTLPQLDGESDDEWRQRKTEGFFEEAKNWVIIILVILAFSVVFKMMGCDSGASRGNYDGYPYNEDPDSQRQWRDR